MKVDRNLVRKSKVNLDRESFSLSQAKAYLGRLMDKAGQGESVYIFRGQHRFLLQKVEPIEPIPMRPSGYFAGCYSKAETQEDNELAKVSVVRPPSDLE